MKSKSTISSVDAYIRESSKDVQRALKDIRAVICKAAPRAEEGIAYGMPAYKLSGKPLVYFAAFSKHIGFYATPQGHKAFAKELSRYKQGKGSVQFPLEKPVPLALIQKMVKFNAQRIRALQK